MDARATVAHRFEPPNLTERRIGAWVHAAELHRTAIRLDELSDLLPAEGPGSREELARWLALHPEYGRVVGERVVKAGGSDDVLEERRTRGRQFLVEATGLWERELAWARRWVLAASVTGSTAYGEPEAGDDIDFMVVARTGAVWLFLALAYLSLRLRRPAVSASPCFNYVLDEASADAEFRSARGLLFAREALTARPVVGAAHYRSLIASASWMGSELPRLYARWVAEGDPAPAPARPASWSVRLLNAAIYPWLATYLQLQGLARNRRLARSADTSARFRTVTALGRLAYESVHFERLRAQCETVSPSPAGGP